MGWTSGPTGVGLIGNGRYNGLRRGSNRWSRNRAHGRRKETDSPHQSN
ncbi:hypothetical protein LINGRAHAP2_LOCUS849 [Linum grandiflorum]